jgi:hypothetical protein
MGIRYAGTKLNVESGVSGLKIGINSEGTDIICDVDSGAFKWGVRSVGSAINVLSEGSGNKTSFVPAGTTVNVLSSAYGSKSVASSAYTTINVGVISNAYKIYTASAGTGIVLDVQSSHEFIKIAGAEVRILVETSGQGTTCYEYENTAPENVVVGLSIVPNKYECSAFYTFDFSLSMYNSTSGEYEPIDFEISEAYVEAWEDGNATKKYDCEIQESQVGVYVPKHPGIYYFVAIFKHKAAKKLDRTKIRAGLAVEEG